MFQVQADCLALARRATAFFLTLIAALCLLASLSEPARSQTYSVIYNFTGKRNDGATPYGGPILDGSGSLYGTTYLGGKFGAGSVYKLSPLGSSWKAKTLYSFRAGSDGSGPAFGSLARHGRAVYGTTEGGREFGTVFKVGPCVNGCWEVIAHHFGDVNDGAQPIGGVVFDEAGNCYGTTSLGGDFGNGAVFEITRNKVESLIYSFVGGTDAINPAAGVTVDSQGNLYGTSSFGGAFGNGTVYKLSRSDSGWTESVLYNFQGLDDGQFPVGGLTVDKAGNLYGGTFGGGVNGGGTVYQLSPSGGNWTLTTLYSFVGSYGGPYNKLTFDSKGNLYGATNGDGANGLGSVFKLIPNHGSWTLTNLYDFKGGSDGASPYGSLVVDTQGNIFGTAAVGGSANQGVVFEITP